MAGPIKFSMINIQILRHQIINSLMYVNNTPLHMFQSYATKIETCVNDIKLLAVKNKLALDDSKTEVIHLSSRFQVEHNPLYNI